MLGYSYSPLTRLAPYCLCGPSDCHGRAPRLRSVVVLHCLCGGCQRLGFLSNGCNVTTVFRGPRTSLCSSFIVGYLEFQKWFINYFFCQVSTARVYLLIPPRVFISCFLFRPFSQSLISYFARLVCGWSRTRETWVDGFFPGACWRKIGDWVLSLP